MKNFGPLAVQGPVYGPRAHIQRSKRGEELGVSARYAGVHSSMTTHTNPLLCQALSVNLADAHNPPPSPTHRILIIIQVVFLHPMRPTE